MLVLQCKRNDPFFLEIDLGGGKMVKASVSVVDIRHDRVRIGIEAPKSIVNIRRGKIESAITEKTVEELTAEVKAAHHS